MAVSPQSVVDNLASWTCQLIDAIGSRVPNEYQMDRHPIGRDASFRGETISAPEMAS